MDCDRPFKYKVVTKRRFHSSNYAIFRAFPFVPRFLFTRARARERERKERREIDGTSRLERIFHERNL